MTQQLKQLKIDIDNVNSLIKEGKIMDAFEKYYGEEVIIHENGNKPIHGKDENRKRGITFLWEIDEVYNAEIIAVTIGTDVSMTEWSIDVKTKDGVKTQIYRVNVQHWKDRKIISERLYFCKD